MEILPDQIIVLTGAQLREFATEVVRQTAEAVLASMPQTSEADKQYGFGLDCIKELFGVGKSTAQHYKNTFLKPAVSQRGRKLCVDIEMARRLYAENEGKAQ